LSRRRSMMTPGRVAIQVMWAARSTASLSRATTENADVSNPPMFRQNRLEGNGLSSDPRALASVHLTRPSCSCCLRPPVRPPAPAPQHRPQCALAEIPGGRMNPPLGGFHGRRMPRQRGCVRRRRGARGLAGFLGLVDPSAARLPWRSRCRVDAWFPSAWAVRAYRRSAAACDGATRLAPLRALGLPTLSG
jgi:hypothetical protein